MKAHIKEMAFVGPIAQTAGAMYRNIKGRIDQYKFYILRKKFLSQNKQLRSSSIHRRCFLLATGPSVKQQDLSKLAGELAISVSNFFVHPDFATIKPKYHIFAPSHDPIPDSQIVIWFKDAEKHFRDGQEVFIALHDKILVDNNNLFQKQKVYYYQIDFDHKGQISDIDFTKRIPAIQTVGHLALYLAIYLGAPEIYLIGYDHNWILNMGKSSHFYEEKQSALVREGYNEMINRNMENEFRNYLNLWLLYKNIRKFAERKKIVIKNATPTSLLDLFPIANLNDILKK